MERQPIRIAVIVGTHGRGSNMQAIIDGCNRSQIRGTVELVIAPSADSPALVRATDQGIRGEVIPYDPQDPEAFNDSLLSHLVSHQIDLVVLGGFLRKLGPNVVTAYSGRIMNIHPALIPSFCGKGMYGHHVHRAVLDSGVKVSGCTVHFVDENYDCGPIIMQRVVPVEFDDTIETLAARVLEQEHQAYAECVALFAQDRLQIADGRVRIIDEPQPSRESAMEPVLQTIESRTAVGMQVVGRNSADFSALWEVFVNRIGEIPDASPSGPYYGICECAGDEGICYTACVEASSRCDVPSGMVEKTIAPGKYAVFTHKGDLSGIPKSYEYIYETWLPMSGSSMDHRAAFELYDSRFVPGSPDSELDIYIPLAG